MFVYVCARGSEFVHVMNSIFLLVFFFARFNGIGVSLVSFIIDNIIQFSNGKKDRQIDAFRKREGGRKNKKCGVWKHAKRNKLYINSLDKQ